MISNGVISFVEVPSLNLKKREHACEASSHHFNPPWNQQEQEEEDVIEGLRDGFLSGVYM
jgi:uncharacterized membrane protein